VSDRFVVIFEPLPDRPGRVEPLPEIRLRQLLKIAGRALRLRAVSVTKLRHEDLLAIESAVRW
jgi:hypothetical protein